MPIAENHNNYSFQSNDDDEFTRLNDSNGQTGANLDKKISRKAVFRKTVDYNSSVSLYIEQRSFSRRCNRSVIQPDIMYQHLVCFYLICFPIA